MMSEKTSTRQFRVGASELVTDSADRLRGVGTRRARENRRMIAAGRIDGPRLERPAIHSLQIGQKERPGKPATERRHDVRNAFVLEQRRSHLHDVGSARERGSGNSESLLDSGDVDRDLECESVSDLIENARGRGMGHLRGLPGPRIMGPHDFEDCARAVSAPAAITQCRHRPGTDRRLMLTLLIVAKDIQQCLREIGRLSHAPSDQAAHPCRIG